MPKLYLIYNIKYNADYQLDLTNILCFCEQIALLLPNKFIAKTNWEIEVNLKKRHQKRAIQKQKKRLTGFRIQSASINCWIKSQRHR